MKLEKLPHDKETAAQLMATGGIEKQDIATQVGIARSTLWKWEQLPEFKARVDELKSEFNSFAQDLIQSKLVNAVDSYWQLIKTTDNARVSADGYRYFIDRQLGKTTDKLEITANQNVSNPNEDLLSTEYDDIIDMEVDEDIQ